MTETQTELQRRIKEQRLKCGYTLAELAELIDVKEATVQRYESGEIKNIKHDTIVNLANIFKCSPAYLMGWVDQENIINLENYGLKPIRLKKFPMLGEIACGQPIYANEDYETFIEASSDIKADFCLIAKGDSMINARIFDGDVVFIKSQPDVENGEIAAVIINDEATLKRVYKYPNRIELRPENPTHKVQDYEGEKLNEIRILGKAVAFQSYIR